jgi:p-hydroxybenzoate 3-monooxygenase
MSICFAASYGGVSLLVCQRQLNSTVTRTAADVRVLYQALVEYYRTSATTLLERYPETALRRAWKAVRFSWWFTSVTHKFSEDPFNHRLQLAELDYLSGSRSALTSLAENYVGLPFKIPA